METPVGEGLVGRGAAGVSGPEAGTCTGPAWHRTESVRLQWSEPGYFEDLR